MSHLDEEKILALSKLQAKFRGERSRELHGKRAKDGKMVCPFLASTPRIITDIQTMIKVSPSDIVYDLGSGDGVILIGIAKQTGARCIGVEIDDVLCATAVRRAFEEGVSDLVSIQQGDVAESSFRDATVIFTFLVPSCQDIVSGMLREQCARGTRIIAYKFPLPKSDGWIPEQTLRTDDVVKMGTETNLYLYTM
jgi:predicted RNA methylase